jgi:hypothetical protein
MKSGWRFFDDENGPANITLELQVKLKAKVLDDLGTTSKRLRTALSSVLLNPVLICTVSASRGQKGSKSIHPFGR